ncbi:SnoaL-like domain-containing protein [Parasphingopyxis algicola]|uniref:nuclear transport factor 2 family protein n=1 Tax=Parasphingopyxis algicola TaxID=2026624 RepID=UPI0015A10FD1|nr:nuclear transport factor 2 family protein [Parasphingopyxis algicola]QLC25213.1 SnoaL-like domain-containing protein [Parasphingopyxis algicola]
MSEDARAVADRFYGAIHGGDFDALFDVLSEECTIEYYGPAVIPFAGFFRGKEKCRIFFGHVANDVVIKDFRQEEFIADGDKVAVVGHLTLELNANGRVYDSDYVHVIDVAGGKVIRFRDFQDSAKAAFVCAEVETPER